MRKNLSRDFALAFFVIAAIAYTQAAGVAIPASHIYSFGQNQVGALGIGSNTSPTSPNGVAPTGVIAKERLTGVDGGGNTSIAISSNGSVYTWGVGFGSGLGYPVASVGTSTPMERIPKRVPANFNASAVSVSAGADHMLAAFSDGKVWSWGTSNSQGQLGHPLTGVPTLVPLAATVRKVVAGSAVSFAIDDQGGLWAWGANSSRQLGMAGTFTVPTQVPNLPPLSAISVGFAHAVALAADGTVWAWGANSVGQAAQVQTTTIVDPAPVSGLANIVAVAAAGSQSFALAADGTVWGWGLDRNLGINSPSTTSSSYVPRQVMTLNGTSIEPLTGVVSIAAGDNFAIAVLNDGRYALWGSAAQRSLGFGSGTNGFPVAIVQQPLDAPVTGAAAGSGHGFLVTGDPAIKTTWQASSNVSCGNVTSATLTLDGYSVSGGSKADIMLVLDESGSISSTQFTKLKNFASNFVKALDIGPDASRVGIVMFSTDARLIVDPSDNEATLLNFINNITQRDGYTCISCGIDAADASLDAHPRTGATRYIVVVTDGEHNLPGYTASQLNQMLNTSVAAAKTQSTLISVGVGDSIDVPQLTTIASAIPGTTTVFTTTDFDSLEDVIEQLTGAFSNPGATNAQLSVDLGPQWQLVSSTPSSNSSSATVTGPHSFSWSVPELDASGASLQLQLVPRAGGAQSLPASQQYTDDQGNAFAPGNAVSVNVVGCPATLTLAPATSTGLVNTVHTLTATLVDHFGSPISGAPIQFDVVGGGPAGTLGISTTNALGVATRSYISPVPATHSIEASLAGISSVRSNAVTRTWLPPNNPPVANAGGDQSIVLSGSSMASVTLDATASTDDGERQPLGYAWVSDTGFSASGAIASLNLPRGVHTFTLTVDDGEHQRSDTVVINVVDMSPAVVTADVAGTLGQNGWYVSDVGVSFSFDDPESGISSTSNCQSQAVINDTLGVTFTCDVTNGAGMTVSATATIRRDATKPVIDAKSDLTGIATSADGAHAPYSPPGASDVTSGLVVSFAQCVPPPGSLFPIGTTEVTCTATDNAGNSETSTFNIIVNDPSPPEIVPVIAGTPGNGGWYRSDVSVSWAVSDPNSGVGSSTGCDTSTVTADTAAITFTCSATNNAGVSNTVSTTVKRDATPPVVATPPNMFASAVTAAGATVSYGDATASDAQSGLVGSVVCTPASGSQFAIGTTPVTCSIDDAAGNTGSAGFEITVGDTTPPSIASSVTGTPGSNGWFTGPVQLAWTVSDPQSSVTTSGCDPVTLAADTPGVTITCSASSAGGSSSASESVKIDQAGPSIVTPGAMSITTTSTTGTTVSYAVSATDETSGVAGSTACAPASGSFFAIGATTVNCTAADNAGNTSSASFTVTVARPGNGNGGGGGGGGGSTIGSLIGQGHVLAGADKVFFDISVRETTSGAQAGSVDLRVKQGTRNQERFEARSVTEVSFTSANAVMFRGTGKWDGQNGFTYIVRAVDNGEPGKGRDTLSIEVRSAGGALVYSAAGVLNDGNVQAKK